MDDSYLIKLTLEGDERAFAQLVDKYQSQVYNFVHYTLRNEEDSEEVTQDTFLKAFRSLRQFRNEARFSTWLLRIAYNTSMSRVRKKKLKMVDVGEFDPGYFHDNVNRMADLEDLRSILKIALDRLKEEEKAIVTLYYFNEQSVREICDITGSKDSNVKIILHRSRKRLKETLTKMGVKEWTH